MQHYAELFQVSIHYFLFSTDIFEPVNSCGKVLPLPANNVDCDIAINRLSGAINLSRSRKRGEHMRIESMLAKVLVLTVAALLVGAPILSGQTKTDATGKWSLEVMTQAGGTTMPSVTLKQDGEKLTGRYTSEALGEADITGTVKGQQIEFSFNVEVQGFALQVRYTGTIDGENMKGKISLGELGDGTFTGKKQK